MRTVRFYTENKPDTLGIVLKCLQAHGIDGATITHGIGVRKGTTEPCIIVELVTAESVIFLEAFAELLRRETGHDAVLQALAYSLGKGGRHECSRKTN